MPADSRPPFDPHGTPPLQSRPPNEGPTGFARLARKISSRTTDLLAISIIVVGGLSMGGTLIDWWRTDPEDLAPATQGLEPGGGFPGEWGTGGRAVALEFGDVPYSLQRQPVHGTAEQASAALVAICRRIVREGSPPRRELDTAERTLLERLKRLSPVDEDEDAGAWRVYHTNAPLPMIVGTRQFPRDGRDTAAWRVVCWGMAFPYAENVWTLFTSHSSQRAGSSGSGASSVELAKVELPPGSRRILSLRGESQGAVITFEGEGPVEEWMHFFEEWFEQQGWQTIRPWVFSAAGWSARFANAESGRVDIQFGQAGEKGLTGILSITAQP